MDPLVHLLDGPRARRAFALRVVMDPPFSIDVRDRAPLTLIAMMTGHAWLVAGEECLPLTAGDVAIVRGPEEYRVADQPMRDATVIVHPDQVCATPSGEHVALSMSQGVRTWGNAADAGTTMLIGTYETDAEIGSAVAAVLPRAAVIPSDRIDASLVRFLEAELSGNAPGQSSTVDRLLDVLLVHALRAWVREHPERATGWLAGATDPVVAAALEVVHESPAAPWTLVTLAARLNVSRATLASRFRAAVGEPPMTYLTNWRMLLASELLADPRLTTANLATQVGYGSPFALSTAFKRRFGMSPTEYRRRKYAITRP